MDSHTLEAMVAGKKSETKRNNNQLVPLLLKLVDNLKKINKNKTSGQSRTPINAPFLLFICSTYRTLPLTVART